MDDKNTKFVISVIEAYKKKECLWKRGCEQWIKNDLKIKTKQKIAAYLQVKGN